MKKEIIVLLALALLFSISCKKVEERKLRAPETISIKVAHDTAFCWFENQTYIIDANTGNPNSVYSWGTSTQNIYEPSYLFLEITTDTVIQHIEIDIKNCEDVLYFPNSFSPNSIGINDTWGPKGNNVRSDGYSLKIFDSNDNLLFQSKKFNENWDGKIGDEYCPVGYYFYIVNYFSLEGKEYHREGMFQLIK